MRRVLKPGGRVLVLEFSKPKNEIVRRGYDAFSKLWPLAGKVIVGDAASYQYLVESIRMHPDQETLLDMMQDAGLTDCKYHNLINGVSAIHIGFKPADS
jgi:demethylmenaquinone methyltransferase/2-methoxy-6-polyprenyl-1,4-benzoquinol methylase